MKKLLILINLTTLLSCNDVKNKNKNENIELNQPRYVQFENDLIVNSIQQYIDTNNLDSKECFISISLDGSMRKILRIEASKTALYVKSRMASHYTIIDEFIVLIYSDIDYLGFKKDSSLNDLKFYRELFKKNKVELDSLTGLYHFPVWYIKGCVNEGLSLYGETYGDKFYEVPCGYTLKRNPINYDSIWIEKDTD